VLTARSAEPIFLRKHHVAPPLDSRSKIVRDASSPCQQPCSPPRTSVRSGALGSETASRVAPGPPPHQHASAEQRDRQTPHGAKCVSCSGGLGKTDPIRTNATSSQIAPAIWRAPWGDPSARGAQRARGWSPHGGRPRPSPPPQASARARERERERERGRASVRVCVCVRKCVCMCAFLTRPAVAVITHWSVSNLASRWLLFS